MGTATLTVKFKEPGGTAASEDQYVVNVPLSGGFYSFQKEEQAKLFKYDCNVTFNPDPALNYFTVNAPGYYTFIIEAKDAATPLNKSSRTLELHVIQAGASLGAPLPGPPRVDAIFPEDNSKDIMVTTQIVATFSEPVQNVIAYSGTGLPDAATIKLIDTTTGEPVPSAVILGIEGGRMQATLTPKGNLYYARDYRIVLTTWIKDTENESMAADFVTTFRTKDPKAYDLSADQQFSGGRDIDLYTFTDKDGATHTYAYVLAGNKGWKAVDVTDPTTPLVIFTASPTCTGDACRRTATEFDFRSVAVHPDRNKALMAMTENIVFADGNQYGYLRIYDLSERPADTPPNAPGSPQTIGRERLAETFSGIPGKVALYSDYAVVNTSGVGIQVVNVKQAIKNQADNKPSDGSSIVGILDTMEQGYGSPNDLAIFNERSAVFTTTPGWLLAVDLNLPADEFSIDNNEPVLPLVMNAFKPDGYSFTRIGVAPGFAFTDDSGMEKSINLAVAAIIQGRIVTLDLSDMTNPQILGEASTSTATGASGVPIIPTIRDIAVSKDAGLVFVTTYNSIQVYDIKNQGKPKLLNEIKLLPDPSGATLPDGTPVMIPIGETPAIVEKGGWVYLANATKGFRALDLDPAILQLSCYDQIFCKEGEKRIDYYPALGKRRFLLRAIDTSSTGADLKNAIIKVVNSADLMDIDVKIGNSGISIVDERGYAWFSIEGHGRKLAKKSSFTVKLEIDPSTAPGLKEPVTIQVQFNVRNNGNVTLKEVLRNEAVFVYDPKNIKGEYVRTLNPDDTFENLSDNINNTLTSRKFYFVQEMLNQVIPRKRSYPNGTKLLNNATFNMIDEDGEFNDNTMHSLEFFKRNFGLKGQSAIGNSTVNFTNDNGTIIYESPDDTSLTFRRLMRDYFKTNNPSESSPYVNKIIDKATLIGDKFSSQDNLINNGTTAIDTGLYELYVNVVRKYIRAMREEGERYAGERGKVEDNSSPTDEWASRSIVYDKNNIKQDCKVAYPASSKYANKHGKGMSYSYGGLSTISMFNGQVTSCSAQEPVPELYRGNAYKTSCTLGNTTGKYAGLYKYEYDKHKPEDKINKIPEQSPHYEQSIWAGIDCSHFVAATIKNAENQLSSIVQKNRIGGAPSTSAIQATSPTSKLPKIYIDNDYFIFHKNADYPSVEKTSPHINPVKGHAGDIINYKGHIAMVYSDKYNADDGVKVNYRIIHAYGTPYMRLPKVPNYISYENKESFTRKVLISGPVSKILSLGRLKLWN